MRGRPPKKTMTDEQARAASAFVEAAEAPDSGSGRSAPEPAQLPREPAEPPREAARAGEGRETPRLRPAPDEARPWEAAYVRDDVTKGYALRLPEPLYLKLKYVAEQTGRSVNTVIRETVEAEVARFLG